MEKPSKGVCLLWDHPAEDWPSDSRCKSKQVQIDFPCNPGLTITNKWFKNQCGFWFQEVEKILLAAPTYEGKKYCEEEYREAVRVIDYPDLDVYWVDTTHMADKPFTKIALGMQQIRKHFLVGNYDRWFNLEVDIIPPPDVLSLMLSYDRYKKIDWLSHVYPGRTHQDRQTSGFGCSLFSRRLIEKHDFDVPPSGHSCDSWLWRRVQHDCTALELWNLLEIRHLNG